MIDSILCKIMIFTACFGFTAVILLLTFSVGVSRCQSQYEKMLLDNVTSEQLIKELEKRIGE